MDKESYYRLRFCGKSRFCSLSENLEANNATMIEYYITLNMAKELAMVERKERTTNMTKNFGG